MYAAAVAELGGLANDWETHFNMHDASMVADFHTDDGVFSGAFGGFGKDREQIVAWLEGLVARSPTTSMETTDQIVIGKDGVARGSWRLDGTSPEGNAVTNHGNWMGLYEQVDGEWKLEWLTSNLDSQDQPLPPDVYGTGTEEMAMEGGPLASITQYYATHFNMGNESMVADMYTDDAVYMSAGYAMVSGRTAIEAALTEAMSPQLTVVTTEERALGDGWHISRGTYSLATTVEGESMTQAGRYILLAQEGEDGSLKIKWILSNANIPTM
jgi:uncharacterized protein (TIGR02246 family)